MVNFTLKTETEVEDELGVGTVTHTFRAHAFKGDLKDGEKLGGLSLQTSCLLLIT